ncbi:hypothetical protein LX86_008688 [Lentzea aerocolonigenes]|nr:hypothetical protein [Lentzea aerocolonigenes]
MVSPGSVGWGGDGGPDGWNGGPDGWIGTGGWGEMARPGGGVGS